MTDKPIIIPTIRIPALRKGRMAQMRALLKVQLPEGFVFRIMSVWPSFSSNECTAPFNITEDIALEVMSGTTYGKTFYNILMRQENATQRLSIKLGIVWLQFAYFSQ